MMRLRMPDAASVRMRRSKNETEAENIWGGASEAKRRGFEKVIGWEQALGCLRDSKNVLVATL